MTAVIRHPEWLTLQIDGQPFYGFDQEWYPQGRQRMAGCGPTVGSDMMTYVEMKEWKVPAVTRDEAVRKMLEVWKYATPHMHGLYKTHWLRDGLNQYMADHGLRGKAESMSIPALHLVAPRASKVVRFIEEGLRADCPVGFLNLHSGTEPIPYHWHWMVLVKLEDIGQGHMVTLWDEGKPLRFNLENWLATTKFGGGFVRVMGTEWEMD